MENITTSEYIQIGIAVIMLITALAAWKSAFASEKSARASYVPIIDINIDKFNTSSLRIILTNIGKQIARDVILNISGIEQSEIEFPVIKTNESMDKRFYYNIDKLVKNPKVIVEYVDIYNNKIKSIGYFNFSNGNDNKPDRVESVTWKVDF